MTTIKRIITVLSVATALSVAIGASAAELKVGTVDVSRLLKESPQAQDARDDINKKFDSRRKELVAQQDKIKSLQDQLSKNGAVMSASQVQDMQGQLDELQRDFNRKQSEFADDYSMQSNQELSKLQQDVIKAVREFAQIQKYNIIIGEGVFYSDSSVDVTNQVLAQMQKDSKSENGKTGN